MSKSDPKSWFSSSTYRSLVWCFYTRFTSLSSRRYLGLLFFIYIVRYFLATMSTGFFSWNGHKSPPPPEKKRMEPQVIALRKLHTQLQIENRDNKKNKSRKRWQVLPRDYTWISSERGSANTMCLCFTSWCGRLHTWPHAWDHPRASSWEMNAEPNLPKVVPPSIMGFVRRGACACTSFL